MESYLDKMRFLTSVCIGPGKRGCVAACLPNICVCIPTYLYLYVFAFGIVNEKGRIRGVAVCLPPIEWNTRPCLPTTESQTLFVFLVCSIYFLFSCFVFWLIYSKYLTQAATIIKSHTLLLLHYSWFVVFALFKPISNVKYYFFSVCACFFCLFVSQFRNDKILFLLLVYVFCAQSINSTRLVIMI